MAVVYEEMSGSPTISYTRGKGGSGKQVVRIAWADQDRFLAQVFPSPYIRGNQIVIPRPANYPGKPFVYAKSVDVEPWDPDSPSGLGETPNVYPGGARITINYETPEWDADKQCDGPAGCDAITFVSYKVSVGGEFLTYPSSSLRWDQPSDTGLKDAPNKPISPKFTNVNDSQICSVIVPLLEHSLTWPQVAFPPWAAIRFAVGKVNAYNFLGCPPETLLFLGCEGSRDITSEGIRCWNIEYKFSEKNQNPYDLSNPQGWNHFLRPDGPSAGKFMRMSKRIQAGFTTLKNAVAVSDQPIAIVSPSGFPKGDPFQIQIDRSAVRYTVFSGWGTNEFFISSDGNPPGMHDPAAAGATVAQTFLALLGGSGSINALQNIITIQSADSQVFPTSGQFLLKKDSEVMAVVQGQGSTTFQVLRGVQGTKAVSHITANAGDYISQAPSGVYDLFDMSTLFLSGLQTG